MAAYYNRLLTHKLWNSSTYSVMFLLGKLQKNLGFEHDLFVEILGVGMYAEPSVT